MLNWEFLHPKANMYHVGYIGKGLSEANPAKASEQIHAMYQFGGWSPFGKGEWRKSGDTLTYPGDPPMQPIAKAKLRDEIITVYQSDWWCITQPDGSFEVCRLD